MKVTGFTFIKNAIKYDYPVIEAITSILPLCDTVVVAVGNSEDNTLELIRSIHREKIKIIETAWDETKREGGRVLAEETDKAYKAIDDDSDWCFYIQGDEVLHEQFYNNVRQAMLRWKDDKTVDGLLFKYMHFYGSYDYIGSSPEWYRNEIRIIRKNPHFYSYKDAQGFRKNKDEKLTVVPIDAYMYHYGWVKEPTAMQKKQLDFNKLWHEDEWIAKNIRQGETFDYLAHIDALTMFEGTHPMVMQQRIATKNWKFDYNLSFNKLSPKQKLKNFLENRLKLKVSYQNYSIKNNAKHRFYSKKQ